MKRDPRRDRLFAIAAAAGIIDGRYPSSVK